jgi:hypothetical protein
VVKNYPPGVWVGIKPELFEYAEHKEGWAGSHHHELNSFLNAALKRCYICSTIFRDCSTELRAQARSFHTFYELRVAEIDDTRHSGDKQYELDFTIEILDGNDPIAAQQVFDCNGTFKLLPKTGMSSKR